MKLCLQSVVLLFIYQTEIKSSYILTVVYFFPCTGHPVEGLAVCLLTAHSNNPDWDFTTFSIKLLMEHQHLVEYNRLPYLSSCFY